MRRFAGDAVNPVWGAENLVRARLMTDTSRK
jgi:hypothetical protein